MRQYLNSLIMFPSLENLRSQIVSSYRVVIFFYSRQGVMSAPVQNKVVKLILHLETIHSLCVCGIPFLDLVASSTKSCHTHSLWL